jgi:SLT domain-containing protein/phage-related protein
METLREMVVSIMFDADQSPLKELNQATNQFKHATQQTSTQLNRMARELNQVNRMAKQLNNTLDVDHRKKLDEMRQAIYEQAQAMREFRKQQIDVQYGYFQLAKSAKTFQGTNDAFLKQIQALGMQQKKLNDEMLKQNELMKQGFFQAVGAMLARSTQSEKIAENFRRMGNPLYTVNNGLLKVTQGLENMAKQGNAAVLALKMLGPTADMKKLRDMTMMINQGLMRYQSVALAAGVVSAGLLIALTRAAMGPDPAKVRARQKEILNVYKEAFAQRVDEIRNFVGLFEKAELEPVKKADLTKALQSQVTAIRTWMTNLRGLMKKGVDQGLIKELQKAGPAAAMQVKALNSMSKAELNKYVALWREKNALARQQATSELAKLRQETQRKIQELQQSLKPLGIEWEKFKKVWASALKPFVDMFSLIAAKILHVGTVIGQFFNRLNEINPIFTKMIFGFLSLIPILTLLLAPLAIGIGLFNGLKAAFASTWMVIKPLVTGLAAMSGTVALVAAGVVLAATAFYLLWTRSETFRNAVINGWNAIKQKAQEVWGFIRPYIQQAISAVTGFVQEKIAALKTFWQQNGSQILQATKNVFNFLAPIVKGALSVISAIFHAVFPMLVALVKSVWGNIKGVINGALNVIMGLVKVFAGLFTLDFHKMWEGIKQVFAGAIQFIWNFIQLSMFGKVLGAGKAFVVGFKNVFVALWNGLKSLFLGSVKAVWGYLVKGFTGMRNASDAIFNGLKNSALAIWNALRGGLSGLISRIVSGVKSAWTTAKNHTVNMFNSIKSAVTERFDAIVKAAKELPGKIGTGIKNMAHKALGGVKHLANALVGGLAQGINGVTGGINWVLDKIGVKEKIPKWEPPRYAKGTSFHPGGLAIVGDGGGPELIRTPSGQIGLSPARSTLVYLPRGTEVLPHRETKALLESGLLPAYKDGVGNGLLHRASAILDKAKDIALDFWSYLSKPGELMKKIWDKLGVSAPKIGGAFGTIGKGALSLIKNKAIEFVKKKLDSFVSLVGGRNVPGNVAQWVRAAMAITGVPASWFKPLVTIAMKESGGNPRAINLWDINAKRGTPSKGLMQTIDPTFNRYKLPGLNDIWNPVHNAVAAIRYIIARYGTVFNVPGIKRLMRGKGYVGYRQGGIATKPQLAALAEKGWKEYIIPTEPSMRKHALALLAQANAELGYTPSGSGSSSGYTPSISTFSGDRPSIVFRPTVNVTVEGGDAKVENNVKAAVKEVLEEMFGDLLDLYETEVVR